MGYYIKPRIMFVIRLLKCGGNVPAISLRGKKEAEAADYVYSTILKESE